MFRLSRCLKDDGVWIYGDTDSIFATGWDDEKIEKYNEECRQMVIKAGYDIEGGLGEASLDKICIEFCALHSKCYAYRDTLKKKGKLCITIAGVPKTEGAKALKDNIENFNEDIVFKGEDTGKLTHLYIPAERIYNKDNLEIADSVDLIPCSYAVSAQSERWEKEVTWYNEKGEFVGEFDLKPYLTTYSLATVMET